LFDILVIGGMT